MAFSEGGAIGSELARPPAAHSDSFRAQVEALERRLLTQALDAAAGNQSEAARGLGLSRVTFLDKLKRYGISR